MSSKCCITSCYPYSTRKGNVIVCSKVLYEQGLKDSILFIIFIITKGQSPGGSLRMLSIGFGAVIWSFATKKTAMLWDEVFLQIHILLWIAMSFCFYLFLYSMCCQLLDDQHSGNQTTRTALAKNNWQGKPFNINLAKRILRTTPYISSLYSTYVKHLVVHTCTKFSKNKQLYENFI